MTLVHCLRFGEFVAGLAESEADLFLGPSPPAEKLRKDEHVDETVSLRS